MRYLSHPLRKCFERLTLSEKQINEIHIRVERPVIVNVHQTEIYINSDGLCFCDQNAYIASRNDIRQTLQFMSEYSLYAYEDELKQGYMTLDGGYRVGICGNLRYGKDEVINFDQVNALNIRIFSERLDAADVLMKILVTSEKNCQKPDSVLIISPPGYGKTTLLRDLVRQVSDDTEHFPGISISLIDERREIAGCVNGIPTLDVGMRTDVYDGCGKSEGMMYAVRAMGPSVLAVDEIGGKKDVDAILYAGKCGCSVFATVHGTDLKEARQKTYIREILNANIFTHVVEFKKRGVYQCI